MKTIDLGNDNEVNEYINEILQKERDNLKQRIDKSLKLIEYSIKYRSEYESYQFVDIISEILDPLRCILNGEENYGNAYLKEFNDWLKLLRDKE